MQAKLTLTPRGFHAAGFRGVAAADRLPSAPDGEVPSRSGPARATATATARLQGAAESRAT